MTRTTMASVVCFKIIILKLQKKGTVVEKTKYYRVKKRNKLEVERLPMQEGKDLREILAAIMTKVYLILCYKQTKSIQKNITTYTVGLHYYIYKWLVFNNNVQLQNGEICK